MTPQNWIGELRTWDGLRGRAGDFDQDVWINALPPDGTKHVMLNDVPLSKHRDPPQVRIPAAPCDTDSSSFRVLSESDSAPQAGHAGIPRVPKQGLAGNLQQLLDVIGRVVREHRWHRLCGVSRGLPISAQSLMRFLLGMNFNHEENWPLSIL